VATASAKAHRRSRLHEEHEEHVNHERWLITYADMITLLMVLFIVLYSISQVDLAKFRQLKSGIAGGFGGPSASAALTGGAGPLEGGGGVFDAGLQAATGVKPEDQAAQSALAAAEARAAGARQQRAVLQNAQDQIQHSLDQEGLGKAVAFRLEARGLVVTIVSDKVLFDPGQADLRPEGREIVDNLAAVLGRLPNKLAVEGHTDNTPISGRYPSNWELSTARATTVLRELIDRHDFSADRLQAAGYADTRPVAGNDTSDGRAANRRVELVVLADVAAALDQTTTTPTAGGA
jgi:chemotaxis protein MotB